MIVSFEYRYENKTHHLDVNWTIDFSWPYGMVHTHAKKKSQNLQKERQVTS